VLIVEDDADVRAALAAVLESEGYTVAEAGHGEEALRVLRSEEVCLVLLDIFMPVMNGCTFMEHRDRDPALAAVPVVVITADPAAARKAARRPIVEAMTKPIDHDRLLEIVAAHC
jgi:CheY-like chemotaxis protein